MKTTHHEEDANSILQRGTRPSRVRKKRSDLRANADNDATQPDDAWIPADAPPDSAISRSLVQLPSLAEAITRLELADDCVLAALSAVRASYLSAQEHAMAYNEPAWDAANQFELTRAARDG